MKKYKKEILQASGKIRCDKCPIASINCKFTEACTYIFSKGYEAGERSERKKNKK